MARVLGKFCYGFPPRYFLLYRSEDPLGHVIEDLVHLEPRHARENASAIDRGHSYSCMLLAIPCIVQFIPYTVQHGPTRVSALRRRISSYRGRPRMQQHAAASRGEGAGWLAGSPCLETSQLG